MQADITINGQAVEAADECNYLGLHISIQGGCSKESRRQLRMAHSAWPLLQKYGKTVAS